MVGGFLRTATASIAIGSCGTALAQAVPPPITVSGDARLRAEEDWDSRTAVDVLRADRGRLRVRGRLGAAAELGDGFRVEGRLRTGVSGNQQGSNVTIADFDGNPDERLRVLAERYALRWRHGGITLEAGRMAFPFFTTNEYFWDADISPLGVAATVGSIPLARAKLRLTGGGFRLPSGLTHYSGALVATQAVVEAGALTTATGLFRFAADRQDPDRLIQLDGNGSRDYTVLAVDGRYAIHAGRRPLALTADVYRNLQGYAAATDPVSRAYAHARTGFAIALEWGDVTAIRHWQLGARYLRLEKLAVDASYANDDLARFSNAQQTADTDIAGPDLFANYVFAHHWTIGARAMVMDRISTPESDHRARVDLTYAF